jgi:hypothetical protein
LARPDLDALLNVVLPFAEQMLVRYGSFFPFGATMNSAGEISQTAGSGGEEFPDSQELIDLLTAGFKAQATQDGLRATVLCFDVRTIPPGQTEKSDAICARLEHADGEAVDVYLPYSIGDAGDVTCGQLFAARGTRTVFAKPSGSSG